jgi:hypothetical protein
VELKREGTAESTDGVRKNEHQAFALVYVAWNTFFLKKKLKNKKFGDAGYRSPYLSHAKRALYHLSYIPMLVSYVLLFYFIYSNSAPKLPMSLAGSAVLVTQRAALHALKLLNFSASKYLSS